MALVFLSLAFSCVALFVAIRSQARTTGGKIGLAFHLVCGLGITIAAIFSVDPITASQDELAATRPGGTVSRWESVQRMSENPERSKAAMG